MRILTNKDECDCVFSTIILICSPGRKNRFSVNPGWSVSVGNLKFKTQNGKVCIFSTNSLLLKSSYTHILIWLILLSGDIETNPGPSKNILIGTYNVRGSSDKLKTKRLLNYVASNFKNDRVIYSFQETHISENRRYEIEYGWRGEFILSPGNTNARGVLTLFNSTFFEKILFKFGDPNGRLTWIVGTSNGATELYASLYAPNNGKNKEFYLAFFKQLNKISNQYNVDNVYISGDLNIDLTSSNTRTDRKIVNAVKKELSKHKLKISTDKSKSVIATWNHGDKFSCIDYIIVSKHLFSSIKKHSTIWGVDKSDHAAVEVSMDLNCEKGRGLFRPDSTFLDDRDSNSNFRNDLILLSAQIEPQWDPHKQLEFFKVCIRTLLDSYSKTFNNGLNRQLDQTRIELNKLKNLKQDFLLPGSSKWQGKMDLVSINSDIQITSNNLNKLLITRSRYLATRARITWLEKGERSNKYFLNIIHRNSYKSFINELQDTSGNIATENKAKLKIAYDFYSDLYKESYCLSSSNFFRNFNTVDLSESDNLSLRAPISTADLTLALKKCGNTASGPDGIGYKVIKNIWDIYSPFLINSWNFGLSTGVLTPSHRESVICLLEKKGKDKRHIQNLRPISLSNCDIKIITKALTRKCNVILPKIIHPMQAAYIPGRLVHDNIRLINLTKDHCINNREDPILISLDAKKAFDSVSHNFIEQVLVKYNIPAEFINIFRVIYNKVESRVLINGFLTESFPISRSVKQGDALSCVLFNLCIDTLIRSISNCPRIPSIRVNNLHIPKVVAYADDVAILTNSEALQHVFDTYNSFSDISGLYLNVDKTEILRLSSFSNTQSFQIKSNCTELAIHPVNKVKICGVTFSLDKSIEYQDNIQDKILKLSSALHQWRKRNLSIFGRNLILKTFGLSQLIYSMQNTYFPQNALKEINTICFNFLWNKKIDKNRAYERVARKKLLKPKNEGGINAPNIFAINKALKIKQLFSSSDPNNQHFISTFQENLFGELKLLNNIYTESDFINCATQTLNELGSFALNEIIESNSDDTKFNKQYFDLIANINLTTLFETYLKNSIAKHYAVTLRKKIGIVNIKQFLNEYKFPRFGDFENHCKFIFQSGEKLFNPLLKRKLLDDSASIYDGLPVGTNKISSSLNLSTKVLTQRFNLNGASNKPELVPLNFGMHPKENEVLWLSFHNACLTNSKLAKLKLVESNLCPLCLLDQNADHIFLECTNAKTFFDILSKDYDFKFSEIEQKFGSSIKLKNEILLLTKRILFLNKNEKLDKKYIYFCIDNRLSDIETLDFKIRLKRKAEKDKKILLK